MVWISVADGTAAKRIFYSEFEESQYKREVDNSLGIEMW